MDKDLVSKAFVASPHGVIGMMPEFMTPEEMKEHLYQVIRKYHPSADVSRVEEAYAYASRLHGDQKRKSGEPYINHPLNVAIILAELEMDKETIIAALLHDVLEDTEATDEEVSSMFGEEVFLLVDGVTKLSKLNYSKDKVELQADNLRKMFLAMAKDIRVILIKLADRLHNMRTLKYQKPEKQVSIARETLEIYCPLAERLGIIMIKTEMDDLALKYIHPDIYHDIAEQINATRFEREAFTARIVMEIRQKLSTEGIKGEVNGRAKHFFSIYRKMVNQNKTLDQIYDLFAVRIIVETVPECYATLGIIHEMYKPIPGRFKDYIAMPKQNMYQSLHTTLIGPEGNPFEIQIRTRDMHRTAEYGIAAHWKYKEAQDGKDSDTGEVQKLAWLREILEWQRDFSDNREFLSAVKSDLDLFSDDIYAFTPTGDVKRLPRGSNIVDFAYAIHSAVGNHMVGGKVNGKLVPIEYTIKNGDRIEILTSQNAKPSRDWLKIVKSTKAKNKINQWFKTELKDDNVVRGRELLSAYAKNKGISLSELLKPAYMEECQARYGFKDWDSVLAGIGHGSLKEGQILGRLAECKHKEEKRQMMTPEAILATYSEKDPARKESKNVGAIIVNGVGDVAVHFSKCCAPVPGDEIVGFVTRGRGITIHRTDCINIINLPEMDRGRLVEAEWNTDTAETENMIYNTEIRIYATNTTKVILEVTKILSESAENINNITTRNAKNGTSTIIVSFQIKGLKQLESTMSKMKMIPGVIDLERTMG
ncbi:MAG: bifunctional (p)ppGpp synthetase/guanosine-3',5'-bis(diphosphate) 3'-pyrophosphohydrolase [Lachnospiraceae bacterium]|nr:bifunctional (p)ppGpp synthetase/guanosine-3',5'-bis(diphosphate) 3'-pyrophosphohydrolase [Lachnospiraceae bacterium]